MVLTKEENLRTLTGIDGFYAEKGVYDYDSPEKSTVHRTAYKWYKCKHVDSDSGFALYKCIQIVDEKNYTASAGLATLEKPDKGYKGYSMTIVGAVAVINETTKQVEMEITDYCDKTQFYFRGDNEKLLKGTAKEFSLNIETPKYARFLNGGLVGRITAKKLKKPPTKFKNADFDKVYSKLYKQKKQIN